jgi:MSHA biogenesis protein MshI
VIAARNSALRPRIELLTRAGVNLQVVDIVEMAQRNIAALLPQDAQGVALLSLQDESGLVTLTRQGELYLSRNLSVGWQHFADTMQRASAMDQVVLEIQRSLDYYESHFRQAPIRHVALAPTFGDTTALAQQLHINLGVDVTQLDLNDFIDRKTPVAADWQARHFHVLGAALREEVAA